MSSLRTEQIIDVTMPQMGVSVAEGTIVGWRVEVGDRIEADATICDISTDKIDTEVPAPVSGVVTEILVAVDETVEVGTVLARIGSGDTAPGEPPLASDPAGARAPAGAVRAARDTHRPRGMAIAMGRRRRHAPGAGIRRSSSGSPPSTASISRP